MSNADRRHSIEVARRFQSDHPDAGRDAMAAALLHDIGKIRSRLGTMARVAATIIGPRTRRFQLYHDHERLGAEMLRKIGSSPATIAIVDGTSSDAVVVAALRRPRTTSSEPSATGPRRSHLAFDEPDSAEDHPGD